MGGKRTKIVCTIGPASSSVSMLGKMITAGMNVARLNFSHGTHAEHSQLIKNIRTAAKKSGKMVAILQDLQGPKIRVGELPHEGLNLKKAQKVSFSSSIIVYETGGSLPVSYRSFHKDLKKGDRILIDDGNVELEVSGIRGRKVHAIVRVGGLVTSHKGVNLPDSTISAKSFTEKDQQDLIFGLKNGVDWVALSFVTSKKDNENVRKFVNAHCRKINVTPPKIISKIERRAGVDQFLEIMDVSDAIMFARGDLGVELPPEEVPILQKEFTEICRQAGKPIVIATHMLDSMTHNPRATRAETSDVANAVFDHADAVMLSAETATGDYPYLVVKTMNVIIEEAEMSRMDDPTFYQMYNIPDSQTSLAQMLYVMAENDQIAAIVTSSTYGSLARAVNIYRPNVPILMACPDKYIAQQMMLFSSIYPIILRDDAATFVHRAESLLRKKRLISSKDHVAYITKAPHNVLQLTIKG